MTILKAKTYGCSGPRPRVLAKRNLLCHRPLRSVTPGLVEADERKQRIVIRAEPARKPLHEHLRPRPTHEHVIELCVQAEGSSPRLQALGARSFGKGAAQDVQ